MARSLGEAPITTRNARDRLPTGLHWRAIDAEVHLGYRKGKRGGVWLVRWRAGKGYRQAAVGTADDTLKVGTLDFAAASKAARELVERARLDDAAAAAGPPLTVGAAAEAYVNARDARESSRRGKPARSDAWHRLGRYLTGQPARGRRAETSAAPLAAVAVHALGERDLLAWREGLPAAMKATTRQRLVNDVKAALNAAYAANRDRLPPALPGIIKHGLRALEHHDVAAPVARANQILTDTEISRLLKAARSVDAAGDWGGDLFRLVLVLAATGARFSQVVRMRVADCQLAERRLLVPVSRKGRGGKSGSITVPVGADVLDELAAAVAGRPPDACLLERWRSVQLPGGVVWTRDRRGAWQSAAELTRPWHTIREAAGLPEVVPYALRHSSIVKGIRANLPIRLVAALHDTSTAMIERHYSKWITSGLEELARAAIVPLVPAGDSATVVRLREVDR